jgi:hypothetical protein
LSHRTARKPATFALSKWHKLHHRLVARAGTLRQQGSLASRRLPSGRRVYLLRFVEQAAEGRRVQRAVYLGDDPELIHCVRSYLDELRAADRELEELEARARVNWHLHNRLLRQIQVRRRQLAAGDRHVAESG